MDNSKATPTGLASMQHRINELENMLKVLASKTLDKESNFSYQLLESQRSKQEKRQADELEKIYKHFL